jgi:LuxR family maltose regulon positive regulatory protein
VHLDRHGERLEARFALGQLSLLAADRGDWLSAGDYAAESIALADRARPVDCGTDVPAHAARARVALHRGNTSTAWYYVGRALRLYALPSLTAFPWLGAQMATSLGRVLIDLGDRATAGRKAMDARRYLARLPTEGVLRDQYRRLAADLDRGGGRRATPPMTLTTAEMRVLHLLPTNLTLAEIADKLYISRNTVKTHVAAVYRKLHSSSRTQAVHEGRMLGLIES